MFQRGLSLIFVRVSNFAALLSLLALIQGCASERITPVESPQDGLVATISFDKTNLQFTISIRNISDRTVYVLDELRPTSKGYFPCGPTAIYVKTLSGRVITNIPEAHEWWLAGSVDESQGTNFPDDCISLAPGKELSGTFFIQDALYYLQRGTDFDKWKFDKVIKIRAWVVYGLDRVESREMKVETGWISGKVLRAPQIKEPEAAHEAP